jgi:hypothetical protein
VGTLIGSLLIVSDEHEYRAKINLKFCSKIIKENLKKITVTNFLADLSKTDDVAKKFVFFKFQQQLF